MSPSRIVFHTGLHTPPKSETSFSLSEAMLVFSASATPCSDLCLAECALVLQVCQFSGTLSDLCAAENNICLKDCAASF
ncbi:hypothetical protein RRG08_056244 [Elysia crispata]|uniref:Uncharacterized protein n=1 Tax=Elysia crispata TaxID=231223 RepID=A0AAE1E5N8_9GAST|nr:hypothetical protein RRG08_056244 [Elysia crispata]